jgi:hypothetical protein
MVTTPIPNMMLEDDFGANPKKPKGGVGGSKKIYYSIPGKFAKFFGEDPTNTADKILPTVDQYASGYDLWNSLTPAEKMALLNTHYSFEAGDGSIGFDKYYYDVDSLLNDLAELADESLYEIGMDEPIYGDIVRSEAELKSDIDAEVNPIYDAAYGRLDDNLRLLNESEANLTSEIADMRKFYNDQLQSNAAAYNRQASNILSAQHLNNVRTYDALQSDLARSRQNALEAGASAGLRIASNVNAVLSAQNKQAQTSLETSNNLAQMLLNQQQANAGLVGGYKTYMSEANARRAGFNTDRMNLNDARSTLDSNRVTDYWNLYDKYRAADEREWNSQKNAYDDRVSRKESYFANSTNPIAPYAQQRLTNKTTGGSQYGN